jgi:transposase
LEYKQEAVRLVASGQKVAAAAKALGIVEQTLANWVKAAKAGQLRGVKSEQVSAERMENNRLRAELARVTMERDILGKATAYFAKGTAMKYAWIERKQAGLAGVRAVPGAERERVRISSASGTAEEDSHAPSFERDGLAGGDSSGLHRGARGLWMAPRVAATEATGSSDRQAHLLPIRDFSFASQGIHRQGRNYFMPRSHGEPNQRNA